MSTAPVRYPFVRQGTPTVNAGSAAASWRGNSLAPLRSFPSLGGQSFVARANGRYGVVDRKRGPLLGSARGTLDTWFTMGSGAHSVVLAQSGPSASVGPLMTLGVNAAGQAVGTLHNSAGVVVAAWAATTMLGVPVGGLIHMAVAWDALAPFNGLHHVSVVVNDVAMPLASFSVAPTGPWVPFQPTYLATGNGAETGFDGQMFVTQASGRVSL